MRMLVNEANENFAEIHQKRVICRGSNDSISGPSRDQGMVMLMAEALTGTE